MKLNEDSPEENAVGTKAKTVDKVTAIGNVRTVLVFMDLPVHYEFVAQPMPLMEEGVVMNFDLTVEDLQDKRRKREINGPYQIKRRKLIYDSKTPSKLGLTQYLELDSI